MIRRLTRTVKQTVALRPYAHGVVATFAYLLTRVAGHKHWNFKVPFHLGDLQFFARQSDWFAVEEVILEREYDILEQLLQGRGAPVVVDIGANIGMFSLYTFYLRPNAHVLSVEPSEGTHAMLESNRADNPALDWRTLRAALWREDGSISFDASGPSTGSRITGAGQGESVPAASLRTVLEKHAGASSIDIMKIDIEGAEQAALEGNAGLLACVDMLIIELHPDLCDAATVLRELRAAFPHVYKIPGRRSAKPVLLCTRQGMDLEEFNL
jgi:FkbM family methyltransferase